MRDASTNPAAAITMPVSARNGEVVLGCGVMLAGLIGLAALFGQVQDGGVVTRAQRLAERDALGRGDEIGQMAQAVSSIEAAERFNALLDEVVAESSRETADLKDTQSV